MWYVIQTITGKELETVDVIDSVLQEKYKGNDYKSYEKCFVVKREYVWRIKGSFRPHIEPLFPSYVFVETDTPDLFFYDLKQIPRLTRLLNSDGNFWVIREEEEKLIRRLIGDDPEYVVRRSPVWINEKGEIIEAGGVLKENLGRIVKKRLRKRIIVIEVPFLGEMKRIEIGIKVEKKNM